MTVLIAGAGIAGLSLALTCDQIGVPFRLFESVRDIKPLGVGINLQPNAVRELEDLGLANALLNTGVQTRAFGLYTKYGQEIWTEPRGKAAGYRWPQYSVHRGQLQQLLYQTLLDRAGDDCVETGWRATGFTHQKNQIELQLCSTRDNAERTEIGAVLVGADGIHSAIRQQLEPDEGPPEWGGAVLWRGTSLSEPFLNDASMVMIGNATQRAVVYPITPPHPTTGLVTINWIAELTYDTDAHWNREDWNRKARLQDFLPQFENWRYDWLDIPELVRAAQTVYEYPMVDRTPIERWTEGAVTMMGDAAHPSYPVGSNGASQAIVDARVLGKMFLQAGVGQAALTAYEAELLPITRKMTLANRSSGPDAVLQLIEDRCDGRFDRLEDVASHQELAEHASAYKRTAGFAIETLNAQARLIPENAQCIC
ncbi:MAG: flavin-dependent oxidoreductase [Granulosicoccus sp.]